MCACKSNKSLCMHTYIYLSIIAHHQLQRTQIQHKVPLVYGLPRVLLVRHHDCSIDWQRHEGYEVIWDRRHPWFRVDLRRSPPGGRPMTGKAPWQENHLNMDMNGVDFWTFQVGCQRMSVDWFIGKNKETLVWNPKYKHVRFQVSLSHLKVQNLDPNLSATHLACHSFGKWTIYRWFSYSNRDFP